MAACCDVDGIGRSPRTTSPSSSTRTSRCRRIDARQGDDHLEFIALVIDIDGGNPAGNRLQANQREEPALQLLASLGEDRALPPKPRDSGHEIALAEPSP
jgi:hypothetical protein